jgi:hypothetical protein
MARKIDAMAELRRVMAKQETRQLYYAVNSIGGGADKPKHELLLRSVCLAEISNRLGIEAAEKLLGAISKEGNND